MAFALPLFRRERIAERAGGAGGPGGRRRARSAASARDARPAGARSGGWEERDIAVRMKFFTISVQSNDAEVDGMNVFLGGHRILSIDRQLVPDGANTVWAICVNYDEGGGGRPAAFAKRGKPEFRAGEVRAKVDYKDVLSDPEFAVFSRLRGLRKEAADAEGIPAYAVFTNEQLAEMVQRRVTGVGGLREIAGVGESRVEKYGRGFLAVLTDAALPAPEPGPEPGPAVAA